MLVPYSTACSVWKVSFFPVMLWQITRVLLSTNTVGDGEASRVEKARNGGPQHVRCAASGGHGAGLEAATVTPFPPFPTLFDLFQA
jgi:hypothetical protein